MKRAIFPGTFDPFTLGHESVVRRGLAFMDEIIISIGINEAKNTYFSVEERITMIRDLFQNEPRIRVMSYDTLTIDFAKKVDAAFILRGIRTISDFEYEKTIADLNRKLSGIETVLLFTESEYACISSTAVRELLRYKRDICSFVPKNMKLVKTK